MLSIIFFSILAGIFTTSLDKQHNTVIASPLALRFLGKINFINPFKSVSLPLITAFSTSSSFATLPLTLRLFQENAGVSGHYLTSQLIITI